MAGIRVIATDTIQAPPSQGGEATTDQKIIHLTPWDLEPLPLEMNQKGLLFHNHHTYTASNNQIQHLKNSLSKTLSFFPPLAGRLVITQHEEDNTASAHISCNNAGALFVHAVASEEEEINMHVADIIQSKCVPPIVLRSFFQLNGVRNYEGTSQPLLAVQVTELADGVFIGVTINHVVADGESLWQFINSWSQISRDGGDCSKPSKSPCSLQRWFLDGIDLPIHFSSPFKNLNHSSRNPNSLPQVRIFNFNKEKIAKLKWRANAEAGTQNNKISSLQALLAHLWRSVVRCQGIGPEEEVVYFLAIGVRQRMVPPLPEKYFGNAVQVGVVRMKAGELVEEGGGLGKGGLEMNKTVASHGGEKVREHYEWMARSPVLLYPESGRCGGGKGLATGSSPRFDVYGNDFGWGKAVAVRTGGNNKNEGMVSVFSGAEEHGGGGVDIEVCLPFEMLEAMGNDPLFIII